MNKEYSNSIQTKDKIRKGFLSLAVVDGDLNLTVNKLVESIKINRGTFYLHYQSLDDVILEIENIFLKRCTDRIENNKTSSFDEFLDIVCKMIDEDRVMLKAVILTGFFRNLIFKINSLLVDFLYKYLGNVNVNYDKVKYDFFIRFLSGGITYVFRDGIIFDKNVYEIKEKCNNYIEALIAREKKEEM